MMWYDDYDDEHNDDDDVSNNVADDYDGINGY